MIEIANDVGSAELKIHFDNLGQPSRLEEIRYGDFRFLGNGPNGTLVRVAVERKTWSDLMSSIASGRLFGDQLPGLLENYDDIYIYVEGESRINKDVNSSKFGAIEYRDKKGWTAGYGNAVPWHYIKKKIINLEHCGIKFDYPTTPESTALFVSTLYQWYTSKAWEEHTSHRQLKTPVFKVKRGNWTTAVARALGLGDTSSRMVQDKYGSPNLFTASSPDDLLSQGIVASKAMATKIYNRMNGL